MSSRGKDEILTPLVPTDEQRKVVERISTEPSRAALVAAGTGYG